MTFQPAAAARVNTIAGTSGVWATRRPGRLPLIRLGAWPFFCALVYNRCRSVGFLSVCVNVGRDPEGADRHRNPVAVPPGAAGFLLRCNRQQTNFQQKA